MLRLTALFFACALVACSSDDSSTNASIPIDYDGSQPAKAGYEAGAPCTTDNDCASGLACLYPTASGCGAFQVCAPPAPDPCPQPQTFCSCIADTIQACNGYATEAFDYAGPCGDSGNVVSPSDSGVDATVDQAAPPVADAGSDSSVPDAADAATE